MAVRTSRGASRLRWHWARLLHAADSLVLDYRWPRVTAWVQRQYPPGWVKQCPGWAMQGWRWTRRRRP